MKFMVESDKVLIECSVLEGKLLMQGVNNLSHDLEQIREDEQTVVDGHCEAFKCGETELYRALEECVITLPHEDNLIWDYKWKELAGRLAVFYQGLVEYSNMLFYDEVIDLATHTEYVAEDLPKAKMYRDIYFHQLFGEQLPPLGYGFSDEGKAEAYEAERLLTQALNPPKED